MSFHVFFKVAHQCDLPTTDETFKSHLLGMCDTMSPQTGPMNKGAIALIAFVWTNAYQYFVELQFN